MPRIPLTDADGNILTDDEGNILYGSIYPCWGYTTPDDDEIPLSWQEWEIYAGMKGWIEGDQDWGKMQVSDGNPMLGKVIDTGDTNTKTFSVERDKYGTGSGNVTIYIRGSDTTFGQHDGSPSWVEYTAATKQTWRYVQLKMEYLA